MELEKQITWVNSIKETYGDTIEEAMMQSVTQEAALQTVVFGLLTTEAEFMHQFEKAGGDLAYLTRCHTAYMNARYAVLGM